MEASEATHPYLDRSLLRRQEYVGMLSALVLFASLFLPWFSTSDNPQSTLLDGQHDVSPTAWQIFGILDWLLVAACAAPFILAWIIARGHKLSWRPGEVTAIVGITATVLILCNGIVLGRPSNEAGDSIEIGLDIGYLVGLLGAIGILVSGFMRQSQVAGPRKPPGEL